MHQGMPGKIAVMGKRTMGGKIGRAADRQYLLGHQWPAFMIGVARKIVADRQIHILDRPDWLAAHQLKAQVDSWIERLKTIQARHDPMHRKGGGKRQGYHPAPAVARP